MSEDYNDDDTERDPCVISEVIQVGDDHIMVITEDGDLLEGIVEHEEVRNEDNPYQKDHIRTWKWRDISPTIIKNDDGVPIEIKSWCDLDD